MPAISPFLATPPLTLLVLALRTMGQRKWRTGLTGLGIALGVAVVFAVNITNATLLDSFDQVFDEAGGQADLTVMDRARGGDGFDADLLDQVRQQPGVVAAAPGVSAFSLLLDDLGQWQASPTTTGVQAAGSALLLLGIDPEVDPQVRELDLVQGRLLEPGETGYSLLLVESYAEEKGYQVGDEVTLLLPGGQAPVGLTVVGLVDSDGAGRINGGAVAFLPLPVAQDLLDRGGRLDRIDLVLEDRIADSQTELAEFKAGLEQELGDAVRLLYPGARGEELAKRMSSYRLGLDLFSLVAMFVGGFLIYNTFAMNVAERTREIGLLRAVGMVRRQILALMFTEALILSVVGSAAGLLLGLVMAQGMASTVGFAAGAPVSQMVIPAQGIQRGLLIGLGVTLVSALWPTLQAARISPLQALGARARTDASAWRRLSRWLGPLLLAGGWGVFNYLPLRESVSWPIVSSSVLVFFLGAAISVALVDRWLERLAMPVVWGLFGHVGRLGAANVQRAQGRTLVTVATLMLGIGMNVGISSLGDSFRYDLGRVTQAATGGDLMVHSPVRMKFRDGQRLAAVDGVDLVSPQRAVEVWTTGHPVEDEIVFLAIEPQTRQAISHFLFEEAPGDSPAQAFAQLAQGDAVFISTGLAGRYDLALGDEVRLDTPRGVRSFRVAGVVFDFTGNGLMVYGSWMDLRRYFGLDDVDMFLLTVEPGASVAQVKQRIEDQLGDRLALTVTVVEELMADMLAIVDRSFVMFDTLALIVVTVAAMGVVNTMAISVLERQREMAVLRSIGLTRGQVVRMVLAEAGVLGILGGILGLLFGFVLSRMMVKLIQHLVDYELTYVLSVKALITSVILALVISQLAAALPARKTAQGEIVAGLREA